MSRLNSVISLRSTYDTPEYQPSGAVEQKGLLLIGQQAGQGTKSSDSRRAQGIHRGRTPTRSGLQGGALEARQLSAGWTSEHLRESEVGAFILRGGSLPLSGATKGACVAGINPQRACPAALSAARFLDLHLLRQFPLLTERESDTSVHDICSETNADARAPAPQVRTRPTSLVRQPTDVLAVLARRIARCSGPQPARAPFGVARDRNAYRL